MPSALSGRQCPAESPVKKTPPSVARRSLWGIQLPWYSFGSLPRSWVSSTVVSLTWKRGSKEPIPIRSSSRAGNDQP